MLLLIYSFSPFSSTGLDGWFQRLMPLQKNFFLSFSFKLWCNIICSFSEFAISNWNLWNFSFTILPNCYLSGAFNFIEPHFQQDFWHLVEFCSFVVRNTCSKVFCKSCKCNRDVVFALRWQLWQIGSSKDGQVGQEAWSQHKFHAPQQNISRWCATFCVAHFCTIVPYTQAGGMVVGWDQLILRIVCHVLCCYRAIVFYKGHIVQCILVNVMVHHHRIFFQIAPMIRELMIGEAGHLQTQNSGSYASGTRGENQIADLNGYLCNPFFTHN